MFQNVITDYISVLDKSLQGGYSVGMPPQTPPVNNMSVSANLAAISGFGSQMQLDVGTSSSHVLVSLELYGLFSSSDPETDNFIIWCRTVVSDSAPTTADTGTSGDWFGFDSLTYVSAASKYAVHKSRFLVPNKQSELEFGEAQYVQFGIVNLSGEAVNGNLTYKMRAHVDEYQFLQPMK